MKVFKFGGSSIQDALCIQTSIDIIKSESYRPILVIYSACGKTTDLLAEIAEWAAQGDHITCKKIIADIRSLHINIAENLKLSEEVCLPLLHQLESFVEGLALLKECTPRSSDTLLAFGELLSTSLISYYAQKELPDSFLLDSRSFIITNDTFGEATPLFSLIEKQITQTVENHTASVFIAQGFIGATQEGVTTTLGRGGSDYSASICAAALEAQSIEIWTDVHGIMTCDPKIVSGAQPVPSLSYEEAAELAFFGAKVVHPASIQPAVEKKIPVWIKNTHDHRHPGTLISSESEKKGIKALTTKKDIHLVQLRSSRMLQNHGFMSKMFAVFARHHISVDVVTTSEVSVSASMIFPPSTDLIDELSQLGKVYVEKDKAIICLVGRHVWRDPSIIGNVFSTIPRDCPIHMISLGSSETNLTLIVPQDSCTSVIQHLHQALIDDVF